MGVNASAQVLPILVGGRLGTARAGETVDARLHRGMFLRPTLLDDVRTDSRSAQEDIFGPALATIPFETYEQALEIANSVSYGLSARVFTRDIGCAHRFARGVQADYVWISDSSKHFAGARFGGFKDSGVGREERLDELESYAQTKNVNVHFA